MVLPIHPRSQLYLFACFKLLLLLGEAGGAPVDTCVGLGLAALLLGSFRIPYSRDTLSSRCTQKAGSGSLSRIMPRLPIKARSR